jgi:hypothetical protein
MKGFFARRRLGGLVLLLAACAVLAWSHDRLAPALRNLAYLTGWLLLAVMLFLTFYNARKKLPFLPLGSSRAWLQLHAYAGWFSVAVFAAHIGYRWPNGWFEGLLATFYALTMLSGVLGLIWSRLVPRRLTARGGEVLFERIPVIRRELAEQAEKLALDSVSSAQSTAIADFYIANLADFLREPRNGWRHLVGSTKPMNRLQAKLDDLNRFLNPDQRRVLDAIGLLARQKDGLDYHHAQQLSLKLWLFTHIPLTYGTLLLTALHVVLVHGFAAGGPR